MSEIITRDLPRFDIGDRVVTKKLGPPIVCTIVGVMTADSFFRLWGTRFKDIRHWTDNYPTWAATHVYMVEYDQPTTPLTKEEFYRSVLETSGVSLTPDQLDKFYSMSRKTTFCNYPEEDLELL
jgi:hypothetical protein